MNVTFGKYKDLPIEILIRDKPYCRYLLSQDWIKQNYFDIYSTVFENFQKFQNIQKYLTQLETCCSLAKQEALPDNELKKTIKLIQVISNDLYNLEFQEEHDEIVQWRNLIVNQTEQAPIKEYVYALQRPDGQVKIGYTKDPESRIYALSSSAGFEPKKYYYIETYIANWVERKLHSIFKDYRKIGEWFNIDFEVVVKCLKNKEWEKDPEFAITLEKQLLK